MFTVQLSENLSTARATGTVTMTNLCQYSNVDVQVDATWTGTRPLSYQTSVINQHISGVLFITGVTGFSQPATASGAVIFETTSFTPATSISGVIGRAVAGNIEINPAYRSIGKQCDVGFSQASSYRL